MAADYSICLGTAGWGVWHSPDAGKSWIRHRAPFPLNSRIQALVAHPTEAHTVFAGGDTGLFVSHNGGARWERLTANGANGANGALPTIWSLAIDPVDPQILFAGTRPAAEDAIDFYPCPDNTMIVGVHDDAGHEGYADGALPGDVHR